jgi:GNAT superfamily N-acetyltransferase
MSAPPPRLDVNVRPYADDDREHVRALLAKTFGSADVFDRFSTGNPLGRFVAVVAEHAGAVVGYNMWNPWLVHTAAGPVTMHQSGASAVDDSMRGQGIFGKLLRTGEALARERGVAVLFGFPNPASLPGFLKAGWEHPRSLRLFASPVPALGIGPLARRALDGDADGDGSDAARFVAWRYRVAGVERRAVSLGGRTATIYSRATSRRGARVHKLLDVVDERGHRILAAPALALARLPGPGVTLLRATSAPRGLPPWLPVRRSWETPLILKRLIPGAGPDDPALRDASYWYGDIDAS